MTRQFLKQRWPVLLFMIGWMLFFSILWSRLFYLDASGTLVTRHGYVWADWAAHFTMGSSFAYRAWPLETSPFLITQKLSYPFLVNFISALLIKLNVPFVWAFVLPSWLCSLLAVGLLYAWYARWLKTRVQAALAGCVYLLNGGVGFVVFAQRVWAAGNPWQAFINASYDVTNLEPKGIRWISIINSMLVPQRAFTLGLPVGLLLLLVFYRLLNFFLSPTRSPKKPLLQAAPLKLAVATGLLLGVLPIIHMHTFLAMSVILSCWGGAALWTVKTKSRLRLWLYLLVASGLGLLIATPIWMTIYAGHVSGFVRWYPGWLAREFEMNFLVFWIKNWGLTPWLGFSGMVLVWKDRRFSSFQKWLWVPFVVLFVAVNLFVFQPWSWDNTKLLAWSSLGISGYAVYSLSWAWRHLQEGGWQTRVSKLLLGLIFVSLIASGTIDAVNAINPARHSMNNNGMYSAEELELAEWVKAATPTDSVWLTTSRHNHWLFNLTGRQAVMTYAGWLWSQGYNYASVEVDIKTMWQDPDRTDLYDRYQVQYVVIDLEDPDQLNAAGFTGHPNFILIRSTPHYLIYQRKVIQLLSHTD